MVWAILEPALERDLGPLEVGVPQQSARTFHAQALAVTAPGSNPHRAGIGA